MAGAIPKAKEKKGLTVVACVLADVRKKASGSKGRTLGLRMQVLSSRIRKASCTFATDTQNSHAISGRFWLEKSSPAVAGRATKIAITWFRGPKTRGTLDHRMQNCALFNFVSRKITLRRGC